mmetsp:Transcript_12081/g.39105  ORF Transcript_12081/g.39105 Transcript_12081/m.39105 type:complete len:379 (-) Transcript_12081:143-1279(-)
MFSRCSGEPIHPRGRWDRDACLAIGGAGYTVEAAWSDKEHHTERFNLCAEKSCSPEEVASSLAPALLQHQMREEWLAGILQKVTLTLRFGASASPVRVGMASGAAARPPARPEELEAYLRAFQVCGLCKLARYGGDNDGGYLMCDVDGVAPPYLAAYSYGVDEADVWGWEMSRAIRGVVHQYDCTLEEKPRPCQKPCSSVFHDECLARRLWNTTEVNSRDGLRHFMSYGTLAGHLEANGHGAIADGLLILKLDIEGYEWGVLGSASLGTLKKFRQIVVEFHYPLLELMDAASWAPRIAAMRNVLEAFAVVHVHVNNGCPDGTCIEVTFASRDFFRADWCAWPRRHSLDQPNSATRPDQDVAGLFPWIANLPAPRKALA